MHHRKPHTNFAQCARRRLPPARPLVVTSRRAHRYVMAWDRLMGTYAQYVGKD
jgi:hypothetical protein